jgi:hypothetical protein
MTSLLLTFASGFANEAMAVLWVHASERGKAGWTALCSAIQALALVVGVGESVHDWHVAPAFIVGYTLGSYVAVRIKSMRALPRAATPTIGLVAAAPSASDVGVHAQAPSAYDQRRAARPSASDPEAMPRRSAGA